MEFSKNLVAFKAIYSKDFKERNWVEEIIAKWNSGIDEFILTTSGSTGLPKQIKLRKEVLIWSAIATKTSLNLANEPTFCCLPTQKTGGFMQIIRALYFGWEIYLTNPVANPFIKRKPEGYSLISLTPMQLQTVLMDNRDYLANFRNVLIGGASISETLREKLVEWNCKNRNVTFWETYGMTETASHVALKNISQNESLFTPQRGVQIGTENGRLWIKINECNLFELTNDVVEINAKGFKVLGRADNVINTGGVKVHPEIIEPKIAKVLSTASLARRFYIAAKPDDRLGEKVVLVLEGIKVKDEAFLLELLKRELPAYNNPTEIIYVSKIEFTDTGKLIRMTF